MKFLVSFPFLTLLLLFQYTEAQNTEKIDSLLNVVNNKRSHDTTKIKVYNDIGLLYASSDPEKAKDYVYKALSIAKKIKRERGIAGAYNCLGVTYYYQRQHDSALLNFEKALILNKKLKHEWGQASALNQIGVIFHLQNKYEESIESYKEAKTIFERRKDTISMIAAIGNIGEVYYSMSYYQKANDYHFQSLRLNEKLKYNPGIIRGYIRIARAYYKQLNYENALMYYNKALELADKEKDQLQLTRIFQKIGLIYIDQKKYDLALEHYQKSIALQETLANQKGKGVSLSGIAKIYFEKKEYLRALELMKETLTLSELEESGPLKVWSHSYLAKCHKELNNLDLANYHALTGLKISKKNKYKESERDLYSTLASITEKAGNIEQSLKYYKKLSTLKDSLYTQEKEKQTNELFAIYETDKKEQEIVLKENEIELLHHKTEVINLQRIILGSGLGLSFIIFGLGFYAQKQKIKRSKAEKEKLDTELEFKKKELTIHALHIAKKNEVLKNLKQNAKELKSAENNKIGLQQLIRTINFDLQDDNNWENFKNYFEEIHTDFNTNAKQKYPDITPNELRLMALLKMNLTSKEIANILNISADGIKKARQRLRRKMNLSSEKSLEDSVLEI